MSTVAVPGAEFGQEGTKVSTEFPKAGFVILGGGCEAIRSVADV